jgi:conjugal transfer/entry exclusion protein
MKKKPTDHEILTALNKIIRESQKPKKVELGAIDDFEKLFNKSLDASVKIGTTFIDAVSKAQSKYKSNISDMEKALKIGNEIKKSAKELGIDLPKAVMNKIDSAEANIKEEKGIISKLQKLYNLF